MPDVAHAFQLGDPVEHRGIVVVPLFPTRNPSARYITHDRALPQGLAITETSDAGEAPVLAVENPLVEDVLLYDGEELVGAKQSRILNVTVLVGASSTLPLPVSCVEHGRWARSTAGLDAARHVSMAHLRRRKAQMSATHPLARGIARSEVWAETGEEQERLSVHSPTHANRDTFEAFGARLRELEQAFPGERGQCGAVLAIGGDLCLDVVSRPDAFAGLWPKLRAGYLLDAIERLDEQPTRIEHIGGFVDEVADAVPARGPSAGLGNDLRLRGPGVVGSGLELDGELLQLGAFTSEDDGRRTLGRIACPSARR